MNSNSYRATHERAVLLDLSDHNLLQVTGPQRAPFLHNLLSNDIKNLPVGERRYATLLTRAGRVVADMQVYAFEESLLVAASQASIAQAFPILKKMILFSKVEVKEAPADLGIISVQGPEAAKLAADPSPSIKRFANDRTGCGGVDLVGGRSALDIYRKNLSAKGMPTLDAETYEVLRIEAGIPRFGPELNEDVVPLEAGLEATAISFTKGCYTGQEVIARIKTYGDVAKNLVGLKLSGPAAAGQKLHAGTVEVGWITSLTESPRFGPIALAYVKRDYWNPGTALDAGLILSLPFA